MRLSQLTSSAVLGYEAGSRTAGDHATFDAHDAALQTAFMPYALPLVTAPLRPVVQRLTQAGLEGAIDARHSLCGSHAEISKGRAQHLSCSVEEQAEVAALPARNEAGTLLLDAHQGAVDTQARPFLPDLTP